jgi:hypothetical protein
VRVRVLHRFRHRLRVQRVLPRRYSG